MQEQGLTVRDGEYGVSPRQERANTPKPTLDTMIEAWLQAGKKSERTKADYRYTLGLFRASLQQIGLDLDRQEEQAIQNIGLIAQGFANFSVHGRTVTNNTFNHRLVVLESFYTYARKKRFLKEDPIASIERAKVQAYKGAGKKALDKTVLASGLDKIDRSTPSGKRNYALLMTLITIGRRANEIATMQLQHLTLDNDVLVVSFEHMKGDKEGKNKLTHLVSDALLTWLRSFYGADVQVGRAGDTRPIWVSLAEGGHEGKSYGLPLGKQAIADVCKKYMGTSKIHAMRHSFAKLFLEAGGSIRELQKMLGHSSVATTEIYAGVLVVEEDKYGDTMLKLLGIE